MVAFSVFGINVYWYGILYVVSALVGYWFLWYIGRRGFFATLAPQLHILLTKKRDDLLLVILLGVLVGGRLGHVVIYDFAYYFHNPWKILAINEGGMSFIGGIFGVLLSLLFFCKKNRLASNDIWRLLDVITVFIPLGSMVGRVGNFLNQELYGRPVYEVFTTLSTKWIHFFTSIGIFHVYEKVDNLLRVNTNFLASFFEGFVLLGVLQFLFWKNLIRPRFLSVFPGFFALLWLFLYSFVRFWLEYLRADSALEYVGVFTKSQWFFLIFMFVSIFLLVSKKRKIST